jgi:hypothetical protein
MVDTQSRRESMKPAQNVKNNNNIYFSRRNAVSKKKQSHAEICAVCVFVVSGARKPVELNFYSLFLSIESNKKKAGPSFFIFVVFNSCNHAYFFVRCFRVFAVIFFFLSFLLSYFSRCTFFLRNNLLPCRLCVQLCKRGPTKNNKKTLSVSVSFSHHLGL